MCFLREQFQPVEKEAGKVDLHGVVGRGKKEIKQAAISVDDGVLIHLSSVIFPNEEKLSFDLAILPQACSQFVNQRDVFCVFKL